MVCVSLGKRGTLFAEAASRGLDIIGLALMRETEAAVVYKNLTNERSLIAYISRELQKSYLLFSYNIL